MVREKLRDKRGFTIIELVAVIAILLIITAIAMPSITSLLGRTENNISKEKEKAFISAARDYVSDNYNNITNNPCNITLETLYTEGYLPENSYRDTDGNVYPGYVRYTYKSGIEDFYEYKAGSTTDSC